MGEEGKEAQTLCNPARDYLPPPRSPSVSTATLLYCNTDSQPHLQSLTHKPSVPAMSILNSFISLELASHHHHACQKVPTRRVMIIKTKIRFRSELALKVTARSCWVTRAGLRSMVR
jgi:hypothetical protein